MDPKAWARLVRIPNVFTVVADVSAAHLLLAHGGEAWPRWLCVVVAGVCLYWSGMIFNDLWDIDQDRSERPGRPLPSGHITMAAARRAGVVLMVLGIGFATISGLIPVSGMSPNYRPLVVSLVLAVAILLYDGPLKRTAMAPAVMGLCRMLSFLLGASTVSVSEPTFPVYVWAAALGFGVYVMGVTLVARREAGESLPSQIAVGLVVLMAGLVLLAWAPQLAPLDAGMRYQGDWRFSVLIGMLGVTVVVRIVRLLGDVEPRAVQMAVKTALLTLIPLAASYALLGAGTLYGLGVFFLIVPATLISARFRMT